MVLLFAEQYCFVMNLKRILTAGVDFMVLFL